MTHIAIVNTFDGSDSSLETTLGISSAATTTVPPSFSPTPVRGGIAIAPGPLPLNPLPGTIAIDSDDGNKMKWWAGTQWVTAGI